jgi:hypothetical protein
VEHLPDNEGLPVAEQRETATLRGKLLECPNRGQVLGKDAGVVIAASWIVSTVGARGRAAVIDGSLVHAVVARLAALDLA